MRSFLLIASLAIIISATANDDHDIVPEEVLYEDYDPFLDSTELAANLNFASQTVKSMANEGKCKELAGTIKKEVDDTVKIDQKVLDNLSDAKCSTEGTALVKSAETALASREKELVSATTALNTARNAQVSFGSLTFSSISENACNSQFFQQTTYITAAKTVTTATLYVSKKKGEVAVAKVAVTDAKAEASRLQAACRCRMKKAALEAFATLSKKNGAHKEAYGRGNMLLCVLAKKNIKDVSCTAAGMPELKMPSGVHQDMCVKYESHIPASKCSTKCGLSVTTRKGAITCVGLHGKNEPEAKCSKIGLKKPAPQTAGCPATRACARWVTRSPTGSCPSGCGKSASTLYGSTICQRTDGNTASSSECAGQGKPTAPTRRCGATSPCPCYVDIYKHTNYGGGRLATCTSTNTNGHTCRYSSNVEDEASSFKMRGNCARYELWDEDKCRQGYSDNRQYSRSTPSVPSDLNDDVCAVTVWARRL